MPIKVKCTSAMRSAVAFEH